MIAGAPSWMRVAQHLVFQILVLAQGRLVHAMMIACRPGDPATSGTAKVCVTRRFCCAAALQRYEMLFSTAARGSAVRQCARSALLY